MEYSSRLDSVSQLIRKCPYCTQRDLNKMYGACRALADTISKEAVTCRRLHTTTAIYKDLVQKLDDQITELEHWVTLAQLS